MNSAMIFPRSQWHRIGGEFLSGGSILELDDILVRPEESQSLSRYQDVEIDIDLLRELVSKSADLESPNELDMWLAPRLHFALRIPRALANEKEFWAWLAVDVFRPYIRRRARKDPVTGAVKAWNFNGDYFRNAVSRLWWGAELSRNGPDYTSVERVFRTVRTAEFSLELAYSAYRPAVLAFASVAGGFDGGAPLSDTQLRAVSRTINAYLSTKVLEMIGPNEDAQKYDSDWREHRPLLEEVLDEIQTLVGPKEGVASSESVSAVATYIRKVADELGVE